MKGIIEIVQRRYGVTYTGEQRAQRNGKGAGDAESRGKLIMVDFIKFQFSS